MKPLLFWAFSLSSFVIRGMDTHPYSITTVYADLQDDRIVMTVRTNAEDLLYFHQIDFDSLLRIPSRDLIAAAKAHGGVIQSGFYVLDQNKVRLPSKLIRLDISSLEKTAAVDAMSLLKYPLVYTLEFSLTPQVEILEFHQELGTASIPAVSFLTISRNANTLISDVELARDKPFTMVRNAVSLSAPERESFMVSYITLSDTRVIHELTIPAEILQSFISIDSVNLQSTEAMRKFITESSVVEIDKTVLQPEITALVLGTESSAQRYNSGAAHIRIEYSLSDLPENIIINWENFNWKMRWFKSIIDAFGQSGEHNFSRFQPELRIKRQNKIERE